MKKQARQHQFDRKVQKRIYYRDEGVCIFCSREYHMHCKSPMLYNIYDYMHYINKSKGGLGIEENGVLGCRYHHMLLDNGHLGLRPEMLEIMKKHLQSNYKDWNEEKLIFKKYDF